MFSLFKKRKEAPVSKWQEAIDKIHGLDINRLLYVHSSDLANFTLNLTYPTITEFRQHLQTAVYALTGNSPVFREEFKKELQGVRLSSFFTDGKGNYVDEVHEGELFVDTVVTFLRLYEGVSNHDSIEGGVKQYNFRILSEVASQTIGLIDILLEVTNRDTDI